MNLDFEFKHDNLSIVELHKNGIRTTKELEATILGESVWDSRELENGNVIRLATGFSKLVNPIIVWFIIDENLVIETLAARRATIKEIKVNFCRYCK